MVEVLCGLLTGLGFGVEPTGRHNDGCFMAGSTSPPFRPLKEFKKEVAELRAYLKQTPLSEFHRRVLSGRGRIFREQQRRVSGIESRTPPVKNCARWPGDYKLVTELDLT